MRIVRQFNMAKVISRFDKRVNKIIPQTLEVLMLGARDFMRNNISQKKKRPGGIGNLESLIDVEHFIFPGGLGIGLGNINVLNKSAPYWNVIDKGHFLPGKGKLVPSGLFAPGEPKPDSTAFREGRWTPMVGGKYAFRAQKEIEPMNYIGDTIAHINRIIGKFMGRI